jgi:hypothetical protein
MPVFRDNSQTNRTGDKGLLAVKWPQIHAFSLDGKMAVRFRRLLQAKAMRLRTDHLAKLT